MLDPVTITSLVLLLASEALPFLDRCPANGLAHSVYLGLKTFVDTSKAAVDTQARAGAQAQAQSAAR
jgi:hypothetical protein